MSTYIIKTIRFLAWLVIIHIASIGLVKHVLLFGWYRNYLDVTFLATFLTAILILLFLNVPIRDGVEKVKPRKATTIFRIFLVLVAGMFFGPLVAFFEIMILQLFMGISG